MSSVLYPSAFCESQVPSRHPSHKHVGMCACVSTHPPTHITQAGTYTPTHTPGSLSPISKLFTPIRNICVIVRAPSVRWIACVHSLRKSSQIIKFYLKFNWVGGGEGGNILSRKLVIINCPLVCDHTKIEFLGSPQVKKLAKYKCGKICISISHLTQ